MSSEQQPVAKRPALDRRSVLDSMPDLVLDAILVRLPIRDAVKTSLLSRSWRRRWETIPDLVFDGRAFPILYGRRQRVKKTVRDSSITSFVNRVMLLHKADRVHKFQLSSVPFFNGLRSMLDNWATKLARSGVQILILSFELDPKGPPFLLYDVHSDFFFCRGLTNLELSMCEFKLPDGFTGFPCLTNLAIRSVRVSNSDLGRLVSTSPKLKRLCLQNRSQAYGAKFEMHAPSLQHLELRGFYSLEHASVHAPMLSYAIITFSSPSSLDIDNDADTEVGANLSKLLGSSTNLQKLEIIYHAQKVLLVLHAPTTLLSLRTLRINWNFHCLKQTECFINLIKSFPSLNHLQVNNDMHLHVTKPLANYWEENHHAVEFSSLKTMDLKMTDASKSEMKFAELVLRNAPLLKYVRLTIHPSIHSKNKREFEALLATQKSSTKASIEIDRLSEGRSSHFVLKVLPKMLHKE